jgi:pimeloyl-ACP methyl ester carboxylesterase
VPTLHAPDGTPIFYRVHGSGVPLILSSAAFSTHAHWESQQEDLGDRLRVIAWDYRGHGRSGVPKSRDGWEFDRVIDDLAAVHDAAAAGEPAVMGGLSVGGLISIVYALRHPERVRALVLVNTGPGFKNPDAQARWEGQLERVAKRFEERGVDGHLEGSRAQAEILGLDPERPAAQRAREAVLESTSEGLSSFARFVSARVPGVIDRLAEIGVPTLILVAEHDPAFHRAGEVMAAKIPGARKRMIAGAGHVLNLDRPAEFAAAIGEFLSEHGIL